MLRNWILALLFVCFNGMTVFGQEVVLTGIVVDAKTQAPIDYVSIGIPGTNLGTLSNEDGRFQLRLPENATKIAFSHVIYDEQTVAIVSGQTELKIVLQPKTFNLDEVLINQKPAKVVLAGAIASSKKELSKSLLLNTYYREFVKVDQNYTMFADGMVDFFIRKSNGKSDVSVKQSRVKRLYDDNPEKVTATDITSPFDITDSFKSPYRFDFLEKIIKSKDYDFVYSAQSDDEGQQVTVIEIQPKKEVEDLLYEGKVILDTKNNLVLEYDFKLSPDHLQYSKMRNILIAKVKLNGFHAKATFRMKGSRYMLVYNMKKFSMYLKMGSKVDNNFEFVSDLTVLDYKEGEFVLNPKYDQKSLYKNGNKYTEHFWKKNNIRLLSLAEEAVLKKLSESN